MASLEEQFRKAAENSRNLKNRPDDDTMLEIYSYYKQAIAMKAYVKLINHLEALD